MWSKIKKYTYTDFPYGSPSASSFPVFGVGVRSSKAQQNKQTSRNELQDMICMEQPIVRTELLYTRGWRSSTKRCELCQYCQKYDNASVNVDNGHIVARQPCSQGWSPPRIVWMVSNHSLFLPSICCRKNDTAMFVSCVFCHDDLFRIQMQLLFVRRKVRIMFFIYKIDLDNCSVMNFCSSGLT